MSDLRPLGTSAKLRPLRTSTIIKRPVWKVLCTQTQIHKWSCSELCATETWAQDEYKILLRWNSPRGLDKHAPRRQRSRTRYAHSARPWQDTSRELQKVIWSQACKSHQKHFFRAAVSAETPGPTPLHSLRWASSLVQQRPQFLVLHSMPDLQVSFLIPLALV